MDVMGDSERIELQCLTQPVTVEELNAIMSLFDMPGWRLLERIKTKDAEMAARLAVDPTQSEETRKMFCIILRELIHFIELRQNIIEAVNGVESDKNDTFLRIVMRGATKRLDAFVSFVSHGVSKQR